MTNIRNYKNAGLTLLVPFVLAACQTTGPVTPSSGNVQYGDSKAVETVTTDYGSTDLQTMAEAMARSLSTSAPITRAQRTPVLTVQEVKNKTGEYIDTRAITDTIRSQLLKGGGIAFATDQAGMQGQVDELTRQNQSGLYKKSTTKKMGNMVGADYRLEGSIISIVKRAGDIKDVYYKLSLQLINIETGLIEWADEKDIRKTAKR